MPKLKLGNSIVCEYVAQGVNNKNTIVNNYAGDIFVSNLPANLSLAFYVELIPDFTDKIRGSISVFKNKIIIAKLETEFSFTEGQPNLIVAPPVPMTFEQPAELRLIIEIEGQKPIIAIRKRIRLNPELNA